MILIKDLGMLETPNGKKKVRFGIYECPICRKFLKFRTANVINKSSTKCKRCAITIRNTKHGMTGTRVHGVWLGMLARCEHKYHSGYGNYGGRGITVCNEWHDFEVFHAWVLENKQTPNTTLDRIDNDLGYNPENCRFATSVEQANNKKLLSSLNTSGYRGVSWSKSNKNWMVRVFNKGKRVLVGSFKSALEAAIARDNYIDEHNLPAQKNNVN